MKKNEPVAIMKPAKKGPLSSPIKKTNPIRVLHLSDTTLSGSPVRISQALAKYSERCVSRHIVWDRVTGYRTFGVDMVGEEMAPKDLQGWLDWADVIHYHNRWSRQKIFEKLGVPPPAKPGVIQIHSPRDSENFSSEVASGLPIAVVGQYQPRQWSEASFIVPNIIDIWDAAYCPMENKPLRKMPVVSYAPSNTNASGWDNKGYYFVAPHLKRLKLKGEIIFQLIIDTPHDTTLLLKRGADIGIDEIATGSYHLSSLEYLSMGIPCFANIDALTQRTLLDMTGANTLPWIISAKDTFPLHLNRIIRERNWTQLGREAREWMETYWHPIDMIRHYEDMYEEIR